MNDYLLFMYNDVPPDAETDSVHWDDYLDRLKAAGCFQGGSEIAEGVCITKSSSSTRPPLSQNLGGYIKILAKNLEHAREFVVGNPVYERGGTVEVVPLPKS